MFVIDRILLETIGHHIINVLDEHHIGIYLIQVFNQRAMATRAEEQRTIVVSERCVVCIGSHRVGAGLLFGERYVVLHTVFPGIDILLVSHFLLKEIQMFVAHGEMHIGLAVAGSVECALNQVFLHRCARSLGILVEEQHAFRQLTVVESLRFEHISHHRLVIAIGNQRGDVFSFVFHACGIQFIVECETGDIIEVLFFERGGRHIVISRQESEHIFEHTAGGT